MDERHRIDDTPPECAERFLVAAFHTHQSRNEKFVEVKLADP
ncbi:MAG: hypothetical protein QGG09_01415 [Pirellulaceae bacterium]|nr:hypothetical protein [Pirellulaceae bacterium]HJN09926.1 hypothetical protein [Pirellulaceae bacterium]